jgi:hypothetical protein
MSLLRALLAIEGECFVEADPSTETPIKKVALGIDPDPAGCDNASAEGKVLDRALVLFELSETGKIFFHRLMFPGL